MVELNPYVTVSLRVRAARVPTGEGGLSPPLSVSKLRLTASSGWAAPQYF